MEITKLTKIIAIVGIVLLLALAAVPQDVSAYAGKSQYKAAKVAPATKAAPRALYGLSSVINLKVGASYDQNGHTITLKNVGSANTNTPVIVDVDGVVETIVKGSTEFVGGVNVEVLSTKYSDDFYERSASFRFDPPLIATLKIDDSVVFKEKEIVLKQVFETGATIKVAGTLYLVAESNNYEIVIDNIKIELISYHASDKKDERTATLRLK